LLKQAVKLFRDEEAQSTVEYMILLSVTVLGASALGRKILTSLDKGILNLGSQLETDLKTGRAPLSVWEN
jgi:hypothetical protein